MKIFYITHTFNLEPKGGGGEIFCNNLLRELLKKGHEIFVFTPYTDHSARLPKGLRVYYSRAIGHHAFHKFQYLLNARRAVELARKFNPDVVHAQNDVFPALIGKKIKKALGVPLLAGVEYLSEEGQSLNAKAFFLLNKWLLKGTGFDLLVSMSTHNIEKYLLKWGIPRKKIKMIPNGVDTEKFTPKKRAPGLLEKYGPHLIISLKPLHSTNVKGISLIVRAMKSIAEKHPEYKYLIFGGGRGKKELFRLAEKLGLEKNVFFLERVPYESTPRIYGSAEIMVHSFAFEATASMSLLDSMASGNAIIATDTGEIKNVVGNAALLVKPRSVEAIADAMEKYIQSKKLREEKSKRARGLAVKKYSIKTVASEFEKAYTKIISAQAKKS